MGESILSYGIVIVIIINVASKEFLWNKLNADKLVKTFILDG